ncbi:MAG: aminotransferase class V-fold PLP-dependent enzyme [Dehalococcoidia bacterium]
MPVGSFDAEAIEARHLALRREFLLDPAWVFLNHGSYGACPRPVFERYQAWQLELARQPVEFLGRRLQGLLAESRASLAGYLGADADEVVYHPNVTTALNVVASSLPLEPGDEVLTTDHEYGALERTWQFVCAKRGATSYPITPAAGGAGSCRWRNEARSARSGSLWAL